MLPNSSGGIFDTVRQNCHPLNKHRSRIPSQSLTECGVTFQKPAHQPRPRQYHRRRLSDVLPIVETRCRLVDSCEKAWPSGMGRSSKSFQMDIAKVTLKNFELNRWIIISHFAIRNNGASIFEIPVLANVPGKLSLRNSNHH